MFHADACNDVLMYRSMPDKIRNLVVKQLYRHTCSMCNDMNHETSTELHEFDCVRAHNGFEMQEPPCSCSLNSFAGITPIDSLYCSRIGVFEVGSPTPRA
mmetsp:Transcript_20168/g.50342  ORF Transcript_20168/g.50342 Transcript_20168/m.50342 type:complete len:100 (+) Transcript_20168:388-687(+)